jgi:hypothetical protein
MSSFAAYSEDLTHMFTAAVHVAGQALWCAGRDLKLWQSPSTAVPPRPAPCPPRLSAHTAPHQPVVLPSPQPTRVALPGKDRNLAQA